MQSPIHYKAFVRGFNKISDVISINLFAKEAYFSNYVDSNRHTFSFNEIDLLRGTNLTDQFQNEIFVGHKIKARHIRRKKAIIYEVIELLGTILFKSSESNKCFKYDDLVEIEIVGWIYFDPSESVWDELKKMTVTTTEVCYK